MAGLNFGPPGATALETLLICFYFLAAEPQAAQPALSFVQVAGDKRSFALAGSDPTFTPWGFNYDHDERGRLLEDYWETEWPRVEKDFRDMKRLGANVVRVHLQFARFMED